MYLSSLADAPPLTRPPRTAKLPAKGIRGPTSTSPPKSRHGNKGQTSIDTLFSDDVADAVKQTKASPTFPMEPKQAKGELGKDLIADLFADEDLHIPGIRALTGDSGRRMSSAKKEEAPTRSLAFSLGNEILEADLKSLSLHGSELDRASPRTPRDEFLLDRQKRVALVQQCPADVVELCSGDVRKPSSTPAKSSSTATRTGPKKLLDQAPDKDDEWGETDILRMLPDSPEVEIKETGAKESPNLSQKAQLSPNKSEAVLEFGDYQPSILSGPKRLPLAGRRSSPEKGNLQRYPAPAIKTTYIKLNRETDNLGTTSEPGMKFERPSSVAESSSQMNIQSTNKMKEDEENPLFLQMIDSTPASLDREMSDGPHVAVNDLQIFNQHLFATDAHRDCINEKTPSQLIEAHQIPSPRRILHQGIKSPPADRRPRTPHKDDEELSRREKAFCDLLLAERSLLQTKLDTERDSFIKERETLQAKIAAERDGFLKERETLQLKFDSEREKVIEEKNTLLAKAKCEEDLLRRELHQMLSAKENMQKERDTLVIQVKSLREENLMVKEEVLQIENERFSFEKQISEAEQAQEETLMKKLEMERVEAQRIASQLSSEVQLLKSSSIMTQEKMTSLQKLHEQEVQMLQTVHAQELQAKDKQLEIERKFLSDHKTTVDKLSQFFKKGDEWAARVDVLQGALGVERELCNNDRQKWLGALDHTVTQSQAAVQKWENHCSGIQKQLDQLLVVLELGVKEVNTMRLDEKDRLDKEHAYLKSLQGALQGERAQSLADLATAREKLEGMRIMCLSQKEEFLNNCAEERKEIATERGVVIQMREQLVHAEIAFEKQVMEHAVLMQAEAGESAKQRKELERAKEMAADLAQEVEEGRLELEQQRHAFEEEIASVQALSAQAQQKVESAMEMKKAAATLKMEAKALQQQTVIQASDVENQKRQAALAQNELLELKRKHDEERMRLAMERQQMCSGRNGNNVSRVLGGSIASQSSVLPLYDSKSQLFDIPSWNPLQKGRHGQQVPVMPTRASLFSNSRSSFGQAPWIVENIEVSLCLQAQEDFLAEAKRALQNTTQSTSNLLTKATS